MQNYESTGVDFGAAILLLPLFSWQSSCRCCASSYFLIKLFHSGLTDVYHSFLVVVPAIAQRIVDDTKLPVYSAQILDPKPDQVTFTLHTSLDVPLGLRIHTNPLNLSLFDRDVQPIDPYLIVSLPAYNLEGKTNMTVTQKNANILDKKQFVKTLATAVYNKRFTLSAKGSTVGHLGALHTSLTLNKDVELNGNSGSIS